MWGITEPNKPQQKCETQFSKSCRFVPAYLEIYNTIIVITSSRTHCLTHAHTHIHSLAQALLDRLVASKVLTPYERDYELDKLFWYYDEMGGGVEAKRNRVLGAAPKPGQHYRTCVVTTGDSKDAFHTSMGIFVNNHLCDKTFMIQR